MIIWMMKNRIGSGCCRSYFFEVHFQYYFLKLSNIRLQIYIV